MVVAADDDLRRRLVERAELVAGVEVVGDAGTVADAMATVSAVDPDVVLIEFDLPDGSGLAAARLLRLVERQVVMLATPGEARVPSAVEAARLHGYVGTDATAGELEKVIRAATAR